jgi:hypothetical protein
MSETPNIELGQLISVNGNQAIISKIYPTRKNTVEIVYLLHKIKPTYEDAHLIYGEWRFVSDGQVGDYADRVPRLRKYLEMLPGFHAPKRSTVPKKGHDQRAALKKQRPRSLRSRR